jgi:hypothetical protein
MSIWMKTASTADLRERENITTSCMICGLWFWSTGWLKSHTTHTKIFIDGCNSIQFNWINKHTILLWLYKSPCRSCHVITRSRQSVSCLSTVWVHGSLFSYVRWMFIVEHYLESHSYLTCQNEFMDTFPDSPVPNKSTMYRLVNHFHDSGTLQQVASNMRKRLNVCIAEHNVNFQHFV